MSDLLRLTMKKRRTLYEYIILSILMVKEEPVNLLRQTIYCLIPVLDIYAAYRVKRLRWYLIIMLLGVGVPTSIIASVMFPPDESLVEGFANVMMFYYGTNDGRFEFSVISHIVTVLVAIFLIRHWSHKWNKKFL